MMHSVYSTSDKNQNSETNDRTLRLHSPYFLAVQGSYTSLELALFHGEKVVHYEKTEGKKASAELIPLIDAFLKNRSLAPSDLSFIALDQGPGAFTSLRVTIATVNGISFAAGVPLIGIDGLDSLAHEIARTRPNSLYIATLLNAFNGELFYGFYSVHSQKITCIAKGYDKIETIVSNLAQQIPAAQIVCAGNGIVFCKDLLFSTFENRINVIDSPSIASAQQIGIDAFQKWNKGTALSSYILPLYLKTQIFKPKYT